MQIKSKSAEYSEHLRENYPVNNTCIPDRQLLRGKGLNDADYVTQPMIGNKRVQCPAYISWRGMINRCYSDYNETHPTYKEVIVCEEWLTFSNFREWWLENHIDNYDLDKDILSLNNGKIYSPETCIFIPQWLNKFILGRNASRGKYKIGASWFPRYSKFLATCRHPKNKKEKYLGYFDTEQEAHDVWLSRKLEIALDLKDEIDLIDLRIYPNIIKIIKNMI